jgi:hypothetical protein
VAKKKAESGIVINQLCAWHSNQWSPNVNIPPGAETKEFLGSARFPIRNTSQTIIEFTRIRVIVGRENGDPFFSLTFRQGNPNGYRRDATAMIVLFGCEDPVGGYLDRRTVPFSTDYYSDGEVFDSGFIKLNLDWFDIVTQVHLAVDPREWQPKSNATFKLAPAAESFKKRRK